MIDEQKIISMLQAKALGCLDSEDAMSLQSFIDEGYPFPWDDLGLYQHMVSLLPLSLNLEQPDPELKDKVALKLIKLRDELKAKKILEEEKERKLKADELIEEEVDEVNEPIISEPYVEPPIEIDTEINDVPVNSEFDENPEYNATIDEAVFNISDPEFPESGINLEESVDKSHLPDPNPLMDEIKPEIVISNEIDFNVTQKDVVENSEVMVPPIVNPPVVEQENETKQVEEREEKLPDFTKKSVVEKMYRAIEQDFDALKYHYEETERKLKRGLFIAYIVLALIITLLIISFFKLSSNINNLEREVKNQKNSSSLHDDGETNINRYPFLYS